MIKDAWQKALDEIDQKQTPGGYPHDLRNFEELNLREPGPYYVYAIFKNRLYNGGKIPNLLSCFIFTFRHNVDVRDGLVWMVLSSLLGLMRLFRCRQTRS